MELGAVPEGKARGEYSARRLRAVSCFTCPVERPVFVVALRSEGASAAWGSQNETGKEHVGRGHLVGRDPVGKFNMFGFDQATTPVKLEGRREVAVGRT